MDVITHLLVHDDSLRSKETEKKEGIILATTTLAEVRTPKGEYEFMISKVKDKDEKEIYISRLARKGAKTLFEDDSEKELILDFGQKRRLVYCLEKLNVSFQIATHLALNRPEVDLEKLTPAGLTKLFIRLNGTHDTGKTARLAGLVTRGFPVFDLDRFRGRGVVEYSGGMSHVGRNNKPSLGVFRQNVGEKIQDSLNNRKGVKTTMFQNLNVLTEVVFSGNSPFLLIDTPGYNPEVRKPDIFDLVAEQGLDCAFKIPNEFNWDYAWQFVEHFPNREFLRFVDKSRKVVDSVRTELVKSLET